MKNLERVSGNEFDLRESLAEVAAQARVFLDGDDVFGPVKKSFGQHAQSRPDLKYGLVAPNVGLAKNDLEDIAVDEKILPERFARTNAKLIKQSADFSQCHLLAARFAARLIAAIMLSGRAMFLPAMSKAVPWSGDVRTNGRPSVRFTPESNAIILSGTSP